jgi:phenylacetate-CoA ligase
MKEHTSGSTGRPFTVFFDKNYVALRNSLFLRTLKSAGYSFGQKVLLVAGASAKKKNKPLLRWDYASILQSPEHLLASLNQSRPDFLYGCVTSLKLLAQLAADNGGVVHKPKRILATAESLDRETRFLLQRTFDAEVFEFYGLTEMGVVGWECSEHDGYHISEDTVIVEFLPLENGGEEFRLVMTNLDLRGMPLIRFETGDMGSPSQQTPCACGRSLAKLQRVGGRIVDCIKLRKGRIVPPYKITCTLEHLKGLKRYQLIQKGFDNFTLKIEANHNDHLSSTGEVKKLLEPLLGYDAIVNVVTVNELTPPPGQKFRVIESKLE